MRLDARAFGLAGGTVAAILYLICGVAVLLAPEATTTLASYITHMDLSTMPRIMTASGFLMGLAFWTFGTAAVFAAVAGVYNQLAIGSREERLPVGGPATV
ncbi:MAG TPA: DUF5676 family membrane protein [Gemmatimonadales bacterium]|nr:DUF5676 family membrane protein [Gemmatimonadales bacterium]